VNSVALQRRLGVLTGLVFALLVAAGAPLWLAWRAPAGPAAPAAAVEASLPGVVVDLKDDATEQDVARLESATGLDLAENSDHSQAARLMRADVDADERERALAALRADPAVEAAEAEYLYRLPVDVATRVPEPVGSSEVLEPPVKGLWMPDDPRFREQWNFREIGMPKAWDVTRGKGVVVAVIDTGVAFETDDHGCYQAKDFGRTGFAPGFDFIHDNAHPNDDQGHGTHVAGTIAESTNNGEGCAGIAPEARIMPLKVLSREGSGTLGDIADAIRYAADHGADVINMSLGGPFPSAILHSACQYAHKKGVTIVCAAGNSGQEGVGYPAAFPECIAVSSVGPGGNRASYSSYGPQVAIAAPGGDKNQGASAGVLQNSVINGEDDYYSLQGTSMASPHVAGVAALLISQGVKGPAAVKAALQKSAKPKAPKKEYGAGLLDAAAAVGSAGSLAVQRPVWPMLSLFTIALCVALGIMRRRLAGTPGYPYGAAVALALGLLGPDWLTRTFGYDSQINMIGHSLIIPALLLTELESRASLRWLAIFAVSLSAHLVWDLRWNTAPFPALADWQTELWLGANTVAGGIVTLVALVRARRAEG
jgi:serine protease